MPSPDDQPQRAILHVDMDAFYAAVEQRDDPQLRGLPVIVGGTGRRGVVATASYEARRFGVGSAMPTAQARERCPDGIFLPPRMARYAEVSAQIFCIFREFSPEVEGLSLDEAFIDVSASRKLLGTPMAMAQALKEKIRQRCQLACTVGVASNKLLAKLASGLGKPDGIRQITADQASAVIAVLPIQQLWTVGERTAERLQAAGIHRIGDLQQASATTLHRLLGPRGESLRRLALGLDERPVVVDREEKSIGAEETFERDLSSLDQALTMLMRLTEKAAARLRASDHLAAVVQLKLRKPPFVTQTRQRQLKPPLADTALLYACARELLETWWAAQRRPALRLLGVSFELVGAQTQQADLFGAKPTSLSLEDQINARFGQGGLVHARGLPAKFGPKG